MAVAERAIATAVMIGEENTTDGAIIETTEETTGGETIEDHEEIDLALRLQEETNGVIETGTGIVTATVEAHAIAEMRPRTDIVIGKETEIMAETVKGLSVNHKSLRIGGARTTAQNDQDSIAETLMEQDHTSPARETI